MRSHIPDSDDDMEEGAQLPRINYRQRKEKNPLNYSNEASPFLTLQESAILRGQNAESLSSSSSSSPRWYFPPCCTCPGVRHNLTLTSSGESDSDPRQRYTPADWHDLTHCKIHSSGGISSARRSSSPPPQWFSAPCCTCGATEESSSDGQGQKKRIRVCTCAAGEWEQFVKRTSSSTPVSLDSPSSSPSQNSPPTEPANGTNADVDYDVTQKKIIDDAYDCSKLREMEEEYLRGVGKRKREDEEKEPPPIYIFSYVHLHYCSLLPRHKRRERLLYELILASGVLKQFKIANSYNLSLDSLLPFHTRDYLQLLFASDGEMTEARMERYSSAMEKAGLLGDSAAFPGQAMYVKKVVGGTLRAADSLLWNETKIAVHWQGGRHHGYPSKAAGFCYCNDVVLGIYRLLENFERVLYIDMDIHACDAVTEAFYLNSDVVPLSFHYRSEGFYPGTGKLEDVGDMEGQYFSINVPLERGLTDADFVPLFNQIADEVKATYRPDVIVFQAGADGLAGDPLGTWNLTTISFIHALRKVLGWRLPTLILGGGGYNAVNVAKCWTAMTAEIVGMKLPHDIPEFDLADEFAPDYSYTVSSTSRINGNTIESLARTRQAVLRNIAQMNRVLKGECAEKSFY